ncbi:MAG: Deoxyribodipyrimidine photo-lyase [Chlamydiales bacterium]|nr:Deoxyribodipyrimidine photo-lyase [Chlamydiales bacterium]
MKILVWFRQDFRLTDNPALAAAARAGEVIPVFIWSPKEEGRWCPGYQSQVWLHHTLKAFPLSLVIRQGPTLPTLQELIQQTGAEALYFNRCYEPKGIERDLKVINALSIAVKTFNASLLVEPWEISTKEEKPYQVFTPFWKTALKHAPFKPGGKSSFRMPDQLPASDLLDLPDEPLDWEVGERAAQRRLTHFIQEAANRYQVDRDRPDLDGVSQLSPYLHFGEIGPRQVWARVHEYPTFARQLFWREFAYHLLFHFPSTPDEPLRSQFALFPWAEDAHMLQAWKKGKTGYPIVDAGMRQLLQTGWMHNRVRMIVASFLTKDLLVPWQKGAKWFWERLVDADLANNTLGWQWTAGCGADAAPYFRIFNPVSQGKKFDPEGNYVLRFVPELASVPSQFIHAPWEWSEKVSDYPGPIVDHQWARTRALNAYEEVKKT